MTKDELGRIELLIAHLRGINKINDTMNQNKILLDQIVDGITSLRIELKIYFRRIGLAFMVVIAVMYFLH